MSAVDELLAFDDEPELLSFRFRQDALPMWTVVRWSLFSSALERAFGRQVGHAAAEPLTLAERADTYARALALNPLFVRRRFDIAVFGASVGVVLEREGRWFDRTNDYFAVEYPERTLVIDRTYRGRYKHPRYPAHVRCYDGLVYAAEAIGRLAGPHADDRATTARFVAFVASRFPASLAPPSFDALAPTLHGWSARLPTLHALHQRLFDRVRPKLIFVEDGSYGGFPHLNAWARARGIVTAELQHGVIVPSHLAYNYGPSLRRSAELARCLPEHLIVYGDYWREQVRTPSRIVVVGSPHFAARRAELAAQPRAAGREVLVISQGDQTAALVALTEALAAQLPERRFLFRLHPGEVPFRDRWERLRRVANVRISDRGDIYDCFREAAIVVGHSSTALFEAAGLGLPIFVYDDESSRMYIPEGLGVRFRHADELVAQLSRPLPPAEAGHYWAEDWRARYRAFVERVCG